MRLLSCAIVVLAGAACYSAGMFGDADERAVGMLILAIGSALFLIEYFRTWNASR